MSAALSLLLLLSSGARAQEGPPLEFDPILELRARGFVGYTDGLRHGVSDESRLLTRSRVGQHLERGTVQAEVAVQGYRTWLPTGMDDYDLGTPVLEVYRAWGSVAAEVPGGVALVFSVGRQPLTIHRGRLVSEYDWSARSNPLDAVVLDLELGAFHWRAANIRDFDDPTSLEDPGTSLAVIGFGKEDPLKAWVLDLVSIVDTPGGTTRATVGLFGTWEQERLALGMEAYAQSLQLDDDPESAALVSSWVAYTLGSDRFLELHLQGDLYTPELAAAGPGGFRAPLGDHFAFLGHMNLFQAPLDVDGRGITDLSLQTVWRPRARLTLRADLHDLALVEDPAPLGTEVDLLAEWALTPVASVSGGIFTLFPGSGLESLSPGRGQVTTGYGQVTFGL